MNSQSSPAHLAGMRLGDRGPALAQRLDLGAAQHQSGLEALLDGVVVEGAAVLGHELPVGWRSWTCPLSSSGPRPAAPRRPPLGHAPTARPAAGAPRRVQRPSRLSAYLAGAGLVSQNSALCSGSRRRWTASASSGRPSRQASVQLRAQARRHVRGDRDAAVAAMRQEGHDVRVLARQLAELGTAGRMGHAAAARCRRTHPSRPRCWAARARRAMVSGVMSTTERPGML